MFAFIVRPSFRVFTALLVYTELSLGFRPAGSSVSLRGLEGAYPVVRGGGSKANFNALPQ